MGSIEAVAGRWHGFGLAGDQLDQFIHQTSDKIDSLWEAQYSKRLIGSIGLTAYREVVSQVGYFGRNVIARCFEWSDSEDDQRRDIGRKIITHHMLNSVISAVDRIRAGYPEVRIDEDELLEGGIEIGLELSFRLWKDKGHISQAEYIYGRTYWAGERMIAQELGVDIIAVRLGKVRSFVAFLDEFAQQNGRLPSSWGVEDHFYERPWEAEILRRVPVFSAGIDTKEVGSHRREPLVPKYGYPYTQPEDEAEGAELRKIIEMVVNSSRFTDKERVIIVKIFDEFGFSRNAIRGRANYYKLWTDQRVRDYYIESLEAGEKVPPEQVLLNTVINALHFGNQARLRRLLPRLLEMEHEIGSKEIILGLAQRKDYPPGRNNDVDRLRFIQRLREKVVKSL